MTRTLLAIVAGVGTFPLTAWAQAPRDYLNVPVNSLVAYVDLVQTNTETAAESGLPLPNNEAVGRFGVITALWSFPLAGRYGGVGLTQGYASVSVTGPSGRIQRSGFTDPAIAFHANIFGLPALSKDQFAQAIPQSFMTVHLTVNAPLGSYNRNSPVNSGANRWAFTPLLNLDLTPDKGVSWFDLYASGRFVTNNSEFQGNNRLRQRPLWVFSAHYSHNIGKRMYVGFGVNYDYGGETFANGIPQNNTAKGFRPGVSISRARTIWKYRLTLRYELTSTTPRASPTNSLFAIKLAGPVF